VLQGHLIFPSFFDVNLDQQIAMYRLFHLVGIDKWLFLIYGDLFFIEVFPHDYS
jgi:hypothetical protein